MARIEWDDGIYCVGIQKMDDQHKQLVALINALEANKDKANKEFIDKILNTLVQYTQVHFSDEERILKKMHYSDYDSHILQHKKFIDAVTKARADYDANSGSKNLLDNLLELLSNWLVQHILVQDRAYGDYLVR